MFAYDDANSASVFISFYDSVANSFIDRMQRGRKKGGKMTCSREFETCVVFI